MIGKIKFPSGIKYCDNVFKLIRAAVVFFDDFSIIKKYIVISYANIYPKDSILYHIVLIFNKILTLN